MKTSVTKVVVLSHYLFDRKMMELDLNDENVNKSNMAFISIIGTPECLNYYLDEGDTKHYFIDHDNVLNLEFDDIGDDVMYNGHHFKTINMNQAEQAVDFIEKALKCNVECIYIHCRAGMSRSRAFGEFIYRYCKENDIALDYEDRNDYTTMLNYGVLNRLEHAYKKKHKLDEYAEENKEYPDEYINTPIRVINRERNRDAYKMNNK
jgi:protein-tyrosine phosphatase